MNFKALTTATLLATLSLSAAARAENVAHTQQLLATRQCPRCDLSQAGLIFANLPSANLVQANLSGANLSRANLQGADLRGANLIGTSLNGANLLGARLDGANLSAADLRGAYLEGASLEGAQVENAYLQGAIGLPTTVGKIEDFYKWGMQDEQTKNYVSSIANFSQVIVRKPDFAPAYFGRAAARAQGGDRKGAIADAKEAERLFTAQNDPKSAEMAKKFTVALETPPKEEKRKGGIGNALLGILGMGLQLFLSYFPLL